MTASDKSSDHRTDTASASTPPEATGDGSDGQFQPATHVQVPMLLLERDRRACANLEIVLRAADLETPKTRARDLIAAFAGCNHFEAWELLLEAGMGTWAAMGWLKQWGYWPIGASAEASTVAPIRCHKCRREVGAREPCYSDVAGDRRRFWHSRCRT